MHPVIADLDAKATQLYANGMRAETTRLQIEAGAFQQKLLEGSPFKTGKRFLSPQWCWAFGHIGLLHMLIRWFRLHEPETKLFLETRGAVANEYFLKALEPYLTILNKFPEEWTEEVNYNSVYFACPDGIRPIHDFYKMVERECAGLFLLSLTEAQEREADELLKRLGAKRPYIALHARSTGHDPARNITLSMAEEAVSHYHMDVVSIGLDEHPANTRFPSVRKLPNPWLASFLLSASCDRFIGSNSGAWTVAHAYQKPVELMNDFEKLAWIYP